MLASLSFNMSMFKKSLISIAVVSVFSISSLAADKGQGRLFLGSTQISPKDVNTELESQGLEEFDMINQFGVEITLPTLKFANGGFRYTHRTMTEEELVPSTVTDYQAELTQQVFAGILRAPLNSSDYVKLDLFVGAGITSSELKIKTLTQDGSVAKKGYTSPMAVAGGSVSFGVKSIFFTIEAGYEYNKVTGLKETGTVSGNIDEFDLSGSYLTIGLMFDGVPVFKK